MLGEDKKVDAALMQSDQNEQTVTQKDNKKRNTIIGVSSALAVVATLLTTSVATGGLTKPDADAKKVEGLNLLQEPAAQPPLGLELATCTPKSLPVEAIQQTCSFSADRFLKGQNLDINSEEFLCTVGSDGLYSDPTFPATVEGMMYWNKVPSYFGMVAQIASIKKRYGLTFARPTQIPAERGGGPNPSLWGEKGVLPLAIVQGNVGDCWFLSAASAVAETPSRIHSLFENTSYPANGALQVYFHIGGKKQKVIIDDRLPALKLFDDQKDKLFAAKASPAGAWWNVLLEKAAAKLFANYDGLNAGDSASALRLLTGMPTSYWPSKELATKGDDFLWKLIMKGTKNNWPMTTGTDWKAPNYLMPNHAYTVLEGVQLTNEDGSEGPKLVKIRNPHGNSRYISLGPWRPSSDKWTASYKEQTGYTKDFGDQGEFWFPLELFTQDWDGLTVAHYNEKFFDTKMAPQAYTPIKGDSIKSYTPDGYIQSSIDDINKFEMNSLYTLTNPVVQDVYLTCDQLFTRMFPMEKEDCLVKPNLHYFELYKKFVPFDIEEPEYYEKASETQWCNANAQVFENMPVGEYKIVVTAGGNSVDVLAKKNSFELSVKAEQAEVKLAYKHYDDIGALYGVYQCQWDEFFCYPEICSIKEFMYLTQENCKSAFKNAADKKAAAEQAAFEKAAAEKAAAEKVVAEKAAKEAAKKAEAEYGGVGHWLMTYPGDPSPMYCLQVNGDKAGTEKVSKYFINQQKPFRFSTLSKGTCASVKWATDNNYHQKYDGVTASSWRQY